MSLMRLDNNPRLVPLVAGIMLAVSALTFLVGYVIGQGEGFRNGRYRMCLDYSQGYFVQGSNDYWDFRYDCERYYNASNHP